MDKKYLIINVGSTSKKYAVFKNTHRTKIHECNFSQQEYANSLHYIVKLIKQELTYIGIRVVAPGSYFTKNYIVDNEYIKNLEQAYSKAPLHIEPVLNELHNCSKLLPNVPVIALSDSAFHQTLPDYARIYALPQDITQKLDLYRFGYHGISVQSVVRKIKKYYGKVPSCTIVCHLGGGVSITALKNGKSIDTSMGFSPLEGVPMVTRSGSLDPAALIYLADTLNLSDKQLTLFLNTLCGLKGLTGTQDVKKIIEQTAYNKQAQLALQLFVYQIKKYIGAYAAILGKLDLLVFTGTIAQNSPFMRLAIAQQLLDIKINKAANKKLINQDGIVSDHNSLTCVAVLCTDEMSQMAYQLIKITAIANKK